MTGEQKQQAKESTEGKEVFIAVKKHWITNIEV